jgi:hypothetical protein
MSQDKLARRVRREKARKQIKRQLRIVNFYYSARLPDTFGCDILPHMNEGASL